MVEAKGSLFLGARMFVEERFGTAGVEKCLGALPARDREALKSVNLVGWYPIGPMLSFIRSADRQLGSGDTDLCFEMGRFAAEWQINAFHKLVLRFKRPEWLFERGTQIWRNYYNAGRWEILQPENNKAGGRLFEFPLADETFCRREQGWFQRAIELTGGKDVKIEETRCVTRGGSHCEYVGTWT